MSWDFDKSYEALAFEFHCSPRNQSNSLQSLSLQALSLSFGKGDRLRRAAEVNREATFTVSPQMSN